MPDNLIPVANPHAAYELYHAEFDAAYRRVMDSGRYILGSEVQAFETEFAQAFSLGEAVAVASGTEALWLALRALQIGGGAEVIVPALTASATAAAVVEAGAHPIVADVADRDLNLDAADVERRLTARTQAVVVVHLYGNPADLSTLRALCDRHGLLLIEDCAQAHGARQAGVSVGAWGHAAAWSFYPTKNLGAFGDGGLATTADPAVATRVRGLREYGWRERYSSAEHGWNSRLDELQAAFLRIRLAHLEADNARRRAIAAQFRAALPATLRSPSAGPADISAEHLFVVRTPEREAFRAHLHAAGVGTAIHYPVPINRQPAYAHWGDSAASLPVAERAAAEVVSLPMYAELTNEQVERVCAALANWAG